MTSSTKLWYTLDWTKTNKSVNRGGAVFPRPAVETNRISQSTQQQHTSNPLPCQLVIIMIVPSMLHLAMPLKGGLLFCLTIFCIRLLYNPTLWSRDVVAKSIIAQVVKEFPAFCGTLHSSQKTAAGTYFDPDKFSHILQRITVTLSSHPLLGLTPGPLQISDKNFVRVFHFSRLCHIPHTFHPLRLNKSDNIIWRRVQLLDQQLFAPCYFPALSPKYSSRHSTG